MRHWSHILWHIWFRVVKYYRSRSQDPLSARTQDQSLQTDSEDISQYNRSRSINRTVEQTYRSYSSHLYNRHAYIDNYNRPRRTSQSPLSTIKQPYKEEEFHVDSDNFHDSNSISNHRSQQTIIPKISNHQDESKQYNQHPPSKLHYQPSNLEELAFSELFTDTPNLNKTHNSRRFIELEKPTPSVQPLETRLIDPGEYIVQQQGNSEGGHKPIRRVHRRARNYCAML